MDTVEGAYKRWQYLLYGAGRVATILVEYRARGGNS